MKLFAIDPGNTTGIAWTADQDIETADVTELFDLYIRLRKHDPDIIIIERIRRVGSFANLERAFEMQGVAALFHEQNNTHWVIQESQMRKPYLKSGSGMSKHRHDALAHLIAYQRRND